MSIIVDWYRKFMRNCMPWQVNYFILYSRVKRFPNLFRPQDYSVYVFRDNILGHHNKHANLADKYLVREYVKDKGLEQTLTKLLGVWDDANKIDFDSLPKQFALKCNHSCGMNIICQDKDKLDILATRNQLNEWLKTPHAVYFEQHYKLIKPLIICEEFIPSLSENASLIDYKIHCANGKPIFIQCCMDRDAHEGSKMVCYDTEWNRLNYIKHTNHYANQSIDKPVHITQMLEYASILSNDLDYARVDFYDTTEKVFFGEITLTPQGGWLNNFTQEALDKMGLEIRSKKKIKG